MSKESESNSIKLERKKISPEVLERVKLFTDALNKRSEFKERVEGAQKKLISLDRTTVVKGYPLKFNVSLDYLKDDIIEVALFKAAMNRDQKRFKSLLDSEDLHPKVKLHVLSFSVINACCFRDIATVEFLYENDVDLVNLTYVEPGGYEVYPSSITCVFLSDYCNPSFLDYELASFLFKCGLDINIKHGGNTLFFRMIDSVPEEVSIKMLKYVDDIDEIQYSISRIYGIHGIEGEYVRECTYLMEAVVEGKFELARALIKNGADANIGSKLKNKPILNQVISNESLMNNDAAEAVKFAYFLVKEKYIIPTDQKQHFCDLIKSLLLAMQFKELDFVDLILQHEKRGDLLSSALMNLISVNDVSGVKFLISKGVDVNGLANSYSDYYSEYEVNNIFSKKYAKSPLECAIFYNCTEICKVLIDNGADVNFKSGGADVWFYIKKNYEHAKIIVASGKLKLDGRSESEVKLYNQIKAMMKFEQKALTDIKAVQTAYSECNSTSVKKSFISKKTTDVMLKYYVKDYKNKCKQLIDDGHGEFLAKLAGEVIEQIKIYTMFNWPQTYDIAKAFVVNGDEIDISKEIIGEIGEYIFWLDVQDISS